MKEGMEGERGNEKENVGWNLKLKRRAIPLYISMDYGFLTV